MLVHANSSFKYERSAILPFYRRRWHQLSPRTSQKIACLPVCLETHDQVLPTIKKMASGGVLDAKQDLLLSSSYESAMEALSSLITRKRRGDKSNIGGKFGKLERMEKYLQILGLEDRLAGLKIIHVAGTKGKGSTCTFSEAILRECGFRTGLFTSPHLIDVRERFRVDGLDISEEIFLQYFWDCWHHLKENVSEDLPMPPLFQFLTILAFKIFICEQVDVAIIEVGLGGKRDSTNVIKEPVVCGIASLGMDHVETLGNTLGQIAAHKVGIFKPHIPGFTVPQLPEAMDVIKEKASELKVPLEVVPPLDPKQLTGLKLSLSGDHQYTNAALAVALCRCWLQRTTGPKDIFQNGQFAYLPEPFLRGLATARLSGRAQIFYDTPSRASNTSEMKESSFGDLVFYLDGAHSPESMEACARWFSNTVKEDMSYSSGNPKLQGPPQNGFVRSASGNFEGSEKSSKQILLFNCMEVRDPQALLPKLVDTCASSGVHFSKAFFVPSMSTYNKVTSASVISSDTAPKDLSWQLTLQKIWENIIHGNDAVVDENSKAESRETLPSSTFLCRHPNNCNPEAENLTCSAVMPSLPSAIKWLRDSARENPSLRIQVLVTGSLHLVGDVLKLLKRG